VSLHYAVNVWVSPSEVAEDETLFATYTEARDAARRTWTRHGGKRRVTVFDDRTFKVLLSLEPGPLPSSAPPPRVERRRKPRK
jgi:hypothetical protein